MTGVVDTEIAEALPTELERHDQIYYTSALEFLGAGIAKQNGKERPIRSQDERECFNTQCRMTNAKMTAEGYNDVVWNYVDEDLKDQSRMRCHACYRYFKANNKERDPASFKLNRNATRVCLNPACKTTDEEAKAEGKAKIEWRFMDPAKPDAQQHRIDKTGVDFAAIADGVCAGRDRPLIRGSSVT
ncbi:hypothetical protein G7054_g10710 [Neopestalotiopsis clavispora]|nr:hypothetical protein G7054_g10710 [Neopestalotiopsis clavispora]